jgi:hypothetical protein
MAKNLTRGRFGEGRLVQMFAALLKSIIIWVGVWTSVADLEFGFKGE